MTGEVAAAAVARSGRAAREFLARAWETGAGATWTRHWEVAGRRVRVEGIGRSMEAFVGPPCAHLETPSDGEAAGWTLRVWDAKEGPGLAGYAGSLEGTTWCHGRVDELSGDGVVTVWEQGFRTVTCVDRVTRRAVHVAADASALPYHEGAAPLRALWHVALGPDAVQLMHGAAVSRGPDAVLLTAAGGNGKSTTALRALTAGWGYLSDDYVLVDTSAGKPRVWSVYNTAKMVTASLAWFGALPAPLREASPAEGEKAVMLLHPGAADRLRRGADLRAVVVPSIGSERATRWRRSTAGVAWRAMVPDTVRGIAGAGAELLVALQAVARAAPAYEVRLGSEPEGVVRALGEVLDDACA